MRMDASELTARFALFGRGFDGLSDAGGTIMLRLDLYHCDDPDRNRDGWVYPLTITAPRDAVTVDPVELIGMVENVWGDIDVAGDADATELDLLVMPMGPSARGISAGRVTMRGPVVIEEAAPYEDVDENVAQATA